MNRPCWPAQLHATFQPDTCKTTDKQTNRKILVYNIDTLLNILKRTHILEGAAGLQVTLCALSV